MPPTAKARNRATSKRRRGFLARHISWLVPVALVSCMRLVPASVAIEANFEPDPEPDWITDADEGSPIDPAALLLDETAPDWPKDYRGRFLEKVAPTAVRSALISCVPPSITLAQAVVESGWGRSALAKDHSNLFGVKGDPSESVELPSTEISGGERQPSRSWFKTYESWSESIEDHNLLLANDRRYASARDRWTNAESFVRAISRTYASDPNYVRTIISLVRRYDLDRWDADVVRVSTSLGLCSDRLSG